MPAVVPGSSSRGMGGGASGHAVCGCEGVGFAGEDRECVGEFVDVGADVGQGGADSLAVGVVAGVGVGDAVAEVAFDPGQGGVP